MSAKAREGEGMCDRQLCLSAAASICINLAAQQNEIKGTCDNYEISKVYIWQYNFISETTDFVSGTWIAPLY